MQKKIRSQTLRRIQPGVDKRHNGDSSSSWIKIKDFLVTLAAVSGILASVLWIGGRFYAYGYFEQMNIPLYFLSFSPGEYAETYVISIIANIITYVFTHVFQLLIAIIFIFVAVLLLHAIQNRYKELKIREAIYKIDSATQNLTILSIILLLLLSFMAAYNNGQTAANHSLAKSQPVTLYSKELLSSDVLKSTIVPNQDSSLYLTTGLYLLTYNNGKYYLFKELDPISCKPKHVFIIPDNELTSVIVEEASPLLTSCNESSLP